MIKDAKLISIFYRIGIIPKYTEVSCFLTGIIFLLLLVTNSVFRKEISYFFLLDEEYLVAIPLVVLVFILCLGISVYYAFFPKITPKIAKKIILFYVILINIFAGVYASLYLLENSQGLYIIFPIFNLFSAILLSILFRAGVIHENSISNKQAKISEIIFSLILILLLFILSQYVLDNYWAITFSLCLFYASNINEVINKILFKRLFVNNP